MQAAALACIGFEGWAPAGRMKPLSVPSICAFADTRACCAVCAACAAACCCACSRKHIEQLASQ